MDVWIKSWIQRHFCVHSKISSFWVVHLLLEWHYIVPSSTGNYPRSYIKISLAPQEGPTFLHYSYMYQSHHHDFQVEITCRYGRTTHHIIKQLNLIKLYHVWWLGVYHDVDVYITYMNSRAWINQRPRRTWPLIPLWLASMPLWKITILPWLFLVPFVDFLICAVITECAIYKSGIALTVNNHKI